MWRGSLTRYRPPLLPPQDGRGLKTDLLVEVGGPILSNFAKAGAQAMGQEIKKKLETQGPSHSRDGGQEEGDLGGQESRDVVEQERTWTSTRRVGRVRDEASTTVGGAIPASLSTERTLAVCTTTRGIVPEPGSLLTGRQVVATTSQETWHPTRRMVECQCAQTAGVRFDQMVVGPTTSRSARRMARS